LNIRSKRGSHDECSQEEEEEDEKEMLLESSSDEESAGPGDKESLVDVEDLGHVVSGLRGAKVRSHPGGQIQSRGSLTPLGGLLLSQCNGEINREYITNKFIISTQIQSGNTNIYM